MLRIVCALVVCDEDFASVAIFSLAGMLYRSLGLTPKEAFLGLALLSWSMTHALYDSDLQFSTYSDLVSYLVAFLLITRQRVAAYPIIASLGALNRESSGLVPVMLLATCFTSYWPRDRRVKILVLALVSLALYAVTLVVIRASYAPQPLILQETHWWHAHLCAEHMGKVRGRNVNGLRNRGDGERTV